MIDSDEPLRVRAPAKVNLRLKVLAREDGGYHQLETIFCALDFADLLDIAPGGSGIELVVVGADLGAPEQNLVHRAAVAFFRTTGIAANARIRLEKRVPAGAGLGGGSSDAAAALLALNRIHGAPLDDAALLDIAAALGSDVPFFLCGASLALAWGRGERLLALPSLPTAPLLLVFPDFAIPTPDAYRALDALRARDAAGPAALGLHLDDLRTWGSVADLAENDFEVPTFIRYPQLRRFKEVMLESGAILALLSGSGSALFGIFSDTTTRADAARRLRRLSEELRLVETTAGSGDVAQ